MRKFRNKVVLAVAVLVLPVGLVGCGSKMTADEAAVEPCKSFQQYMDRFMASDLRGGAGYADVASKQFAKLASDYPEFQLYADVLEGATDNGVVDDLAGYSKLLKYCLAINKGDK
jgi:hypothetical protein